MVLKAPIFAVHFTECVSRAVAASALTHGILKLMAKIKASPSGFVKLADRIAEISAELPAALAPKVELTRLPLAPYSVFRTPSRDSFEIADAQNARNACHFRPKEHRHRFDNHTEMV